MLKIDYDLTLVGDALYYENIRRWHEAHSNAHALDYDNKTRLPLRAIYQAPTREDFENMKQIEKILYKGAP